MLQNDRKRGQSGVTNFSEKRQIGMEKFHLWRATACSGGQTLISVKITEWSLPRRSLVIMLEQCRNQRIWNDC